MFHKTDGGKQCGDQIAVSDLGLGCSPFNYTEKYVLLKKEIQERILNTERISIIFNMEQSTRH